LSVRLPCLVTVELDLNLHLSDAEERMRMEHMMSPAERTWRDEERPHDLEVVK
jgi:hypothetical protein